jgi:hypothetical protein
MGKNESLFWSQNRDKKTTWHYFQKNIKKKKCCLIWLINQYFQKWNDNYMFYLYDDCGYCIFTTNNKWETNLIKSNEVSEKEPKLEWFAIITPSMKEPSSQRLLKPLLHQTKYKKKKPPPCSNIELHSTPAISFQDMINYQIIDSPVSFR